MSHTRKNRENYARKKNMHRQSCQEDFDLENLSSFLLAGREQDGAFVTLFNGKPEDIADLVIAIILRLHYESGIPLNDILDDINYCARAANANALRMVDKGKKGLFAFDVPSDDDNDED